MIPIYTQIQQLDRRKLLIVLITIVIVSVIIVFFSGIFLPSSQPKDQPVPSPTPQGQKAVNMLPITYDQEKTAQAKRLLAKRQTLPLPEEKIREMLIKEKNPLYTSKYVFITYIPKQDAFEAEIHTMKINVAKDEAISWFKSKGFSSQSICVLPLIFSINRHNAEKLRAFDIVFNPLAPGC